MSRNKDAEWIMLIPFTFCFVFGILGGIIIESGRADKMWKKNLIDNPGYISAVKSEVIATRERERKSESLHGN